MTKGKQDKEWYLIRGLPVPTDEDYIRDKSLLYGPPIGMVKILPVPEPPPTHVSFLPTDQRVLPEEEQQKIHQWQEDYKKKKKQSKKHM